MAQALIPLFSHPLRVCDSANGAISAIGGSYEPAREPWLVVLSVMSCWFLMGIEGIMPFPHKRNPTAA